MKSLAKQLRNARHDKLMSQSQFAKWLDMNLDTYQNLEQGRYQPNAETFIKIMKKIKINID